MLKGWLPSQPSAQIFACQSGTDSIRTPVCPVYVVCLFPVLRKSTKPLPDIIRLIHNGVPVSSHNLQVSELKELSGFNLSPFTFSNIIFHSFHFLIQKSNPSQSNLPQCPSPSVVQRLLEALTCHWGPWNREGLCTLPLCWGTEYFEKPMASNLVVSAKSALCEEIKLSSLAEEVHRRLRNTSLNTSINFVIGRRPQSNL